jgi:hypothetical protein
VDTDCVEGIAVLCFMIISYRKSYRKFVLWCCRCWRRQASEFGGGGAFEGQTHIFRGGARYNF